MISSAWRLCGIRETLGALGIAAFLWANTAHAERGPFTGLSGKWSGTGEVLLGNGTKERIRCRARYTVRSGGNSLDQNLRCASDSYKFDLSSKLVNRGGELSGSWKESSRNMSGQILGSGSAGRFQLIVSSPSFSAKLSLVARGNRLSVEVSAPPGGQLVGVSITLARAH